MATFSTTTLSLHGCLCRHVLLEPQAQTLLRRNSNCRLHLTMEQLQRPGLLLQQVKLAQSVCGLPVHPRLHSYCGCFHRRSVSRKTSAACAWALLGDKDPGTPHRSPGCGTVVRHGEGGLHACAAGRSQATLLTVTHTRCSRTRAPHVCVAVRTYLASGS